MINTENPKKFYRNPNEWKGSWVSTVSDLISMKSFCELLQIYLLFRTPIVHLV